jgi:cytochrome c oxidase assembly protein subunit 15
MIKADRAYVRYTRFVLVFVFLVIAAGGVVRMTQSGMGCPDWPRCFGRWIPPTSVDQLPADYEKYLRKQDIDHTFNVYHTWIEYMNRLCGAVLGFLIIIHTVWSFRKYYRTQRAVSWLALLLFLSVCFQGWLGKRVVDANLATVKITTHMLVALVLAVIPVIIIHILRPVEKVQDKGLKWLSLATMALLLVQIVLGTEVREQVDEVARSLNYIQRELWLARLDVFFTLHKSFAWAAALSCLVLFWRSLTYPVIQGMGAWIFITVLVTMMLGLSMAYYHIPAIAQPLHLICSCTLFTLVFAQKLRIK